MTRDEARKWAKEIQAFGEGKEIECRILNTNRWDTCSKPNWFLDCEYRIKPETRVMYVNVYQDGDVFASHTNRAMADLADPHTRRRIACVRVQYQEGQFDD